MQLLSSPIATTTDPTAESRLLLSAVSWRRYEAARGLEPDECYCFDRVKDFPDLAIEVVVTSGLVDKLEIYRGLGISEVWVWDDSTNRFIIHHLRDSGYEILARSELLPDCDIKLLTCYVKPNEQFEMLKAYRKAFRSENLEVRI